MLPLFLRRALVGSVSLLVLAVPAVAVADPAAETVDASTLGASGRLSFPYLSGRVLVLPSGRKVAVRLPASHAPHLDLLGTSGAGYVVVDHAGRNVFYRVARSGRVTKFLTRPNIESTDNLLSRDGRRVLELYVDRAGTSTATVFDLRGRKVGGSRYGGYASVLDFTGPRVVISADRLWSWTPGSKPTKDPAGFAGLVDLGRDVLFAAVDQDGAVGPTSFASPGTPPWSALFQPRAISPDGAYVAGLDLDDETVQLRRMSDGVLVRSLGGRLVPGRTLRWDEPSTVVVAFEAGRRSALVSCPVSGACTRATPLAKDTRTTTPFNYPRFGD